MAIITSLYLSFIIHSYVSTTGSLHISFTIYTLLISNIYIRTTYTVYTQQIQFLFTTYTYIINTRLAMKHQIYFNALYFDTFLYSFKNENQFVSNKIKVIEYSNFKGLSLSSQFRPTKGHLTAVGVKLVGEVRLSILFIVCSSQFRFWFLQIQSVILFVHLMSLSF